MLFEVHCGEKLAIFHLQYEKQKNKKQHTNFSFALNQNNSRLVKTNLRQLRRSQKI